MGICLPVGGLAVRGATLIVVFCGSVGSGIEGLLWTVGCVCVCVCGSTVVDKNTCTVCGLLATCFMYMCSCVHGIQYWTGSAGLQNSLLLLQLRGSFIGSERD